MCTSNLEIPKKYISEQEDGIIIQIEVKPKSKTQGIDGLDEWRGSIGIRLRAKAEKGKANRELLKLLSSLLDLPTKNIMIVKGEKSRKKTIRIFGINGKEFVKRLNKNL